MKNPEIIKILKKCYNGEFYHIPQETGLFLIKEYVLELKGKVIVVLPPEDMFQLQLYNAMLDKIFTYYLKE